MRAVCLLLAAASALAGCLDESYDPGASGTPPTGTTPAPGPASPVENASERDAFRMTVTLDRGSIAPGEDVTASFTLRNLGDDATYTDGGCGPSPWVFEIVASDGRVVGPLGPDPRCLGPPSREVTLERGDALEWALAWDGIERSRDPDTYEVTAREVPAGTYAVRATVPLARNGVAREPTVGIDVVVT